MRENIEFLVGFGIVMVIEWLFLLAMIKIPENIFNWTFWIAIVTYLIITRERRKK
jgi:hypothetical protein